MFGLQPLSADQIPLEVVGMLKWSLLLGMPSVATYFASTYSLILENMHFFFLLSVAALLVAIVPRISDTTKS